MTQKNPRNPITVGEFASGGFWLVADKLFPLFPFRVA